MTKNDKGRNRWHGATQKTSDSPNYTKIDPGTGWFPLGKQSRIERKPKRGWAKKRGHGHGG